MLIAMVIATSKQSEYPKYKYLFFADILSSLKQFKARQKNRMRMQLPSLTTVKKFISLLVYGWYLQERQNVQLNMKMRGRIWMSGCSRKIRTKKQRKKSRMNWIWLIIEALSGMFSLRSSVRKPHFSRVDSKLEDFWFWNLIALMTTVWIILI